MRPRQIVTLLGFILIIAGIYSPLLRPFHLFNWNLFDLNKPYAAVVLIVAVIGIAGAVANQRPVFRISAWALLALIILVFIAAVMKVHTTFSFIPFKGISDGLAKLITFKWGWYLLFVGGVVAVLGTLGREKTYNFKN